MMMKKLLATMLTLGVVTIMNPISVLATQTNMGAGSSIGDGEASNMGNGSQANIEVSAQYTNETVTSTEYSVDISWGAMEFTYAVGGTKEWNPVTHDYEVHSEEEWVASGNTITVTNHSNTGIKATFSYASATEYKDVTGTFDVEDNVLELATAESGVEGQAGEATKGTVTLTLSGTLSENVTEQTNVGTITVKISDTE